MDKQHYAVWMLHVCVDVASEYEFKGTVYSLLAEQPIVFESVTGFLLTLDRLFDDAGYPQSFQDKRSFVTEDICSSNHFNSTPAKKCTEESFIDTRGKLATYVVSVRTRKDTSWQGAIYNPEFQFVSEFDSELDLVKVLLSEQK